MGYVTSELALLCPGCVDILQATRIAINRHGDSLFIFYYLIIFQA
jgi:hypothetical protein